MRPRSADATRRASRGGRRTACASPTAPCSRKPLVAGREARVERGGEDVCRHALLDRRDRRPAALARVRHAAGEVVEVGRLLQRRCGQVEEPRLDDAAAPPHLADRRHVERVGVELGVVERRGLGVLVALPQPRIGAVEDVEPLGERGHHPVLDPVVHHLHEVPGARLPAVEVAPLLRRRLAGAARASARRPPRPGRVTRRSARAPRTRRRGRRP